MDKKEQTIIEHLTEFRRRFLAVLACFFVVFLVSLLFSADIYRWLTSNFEQKLLVLGPDDILWIYIKPLQLLCKSVIVIACIDHNRMSIFGIKIDIRNILSDTTYSVINKTCV